MKRIVTVVFALAIFGLGGIARAAEESPSDGMPRVAQAESPAHSGEDRPAMLSDIRNAESRINARIDGVEARMDEMGKRMDRMDNRIESLRGDIGVIRAGLYAILVIMLAGILGFLFKDRRSLGAPAVIVVLGMLAAAGIVLASA